MINLSYNGKKFRQREDGYVNLGQLCATHGKYLKDWKKNKSSIDYIKALAETLTASGGGNILPDELVVSGVNQIGGDAGTWGHPLIAIEVARWINPAFGVWCNLHIKVLIETGKTEIVQQSTQLALPPELASELSCIREETRVIREENRIIIGILKSFTDTVNSASEAIAAKAEEKLDAYHARKADEFRRIREQNEIKRYLGNN